MYSYSPVVMSETCERCFIVVKMVMKLKTLLGKILEERKTSTIESGCISDVSYLVGYFQHDVSRTGRKIIKKRHYDDETEDSDTSPQQQPTSGK